MPDYLDTWVARRQAPTVQCAHHVVEVCDDGRLWTACGMPHHGWAPEQVEIAEQDVPQCKRCLRYDDEPRDIGLRIALTESEAMALAVVVNDGLGCEKMQRARFADPTVEELVVRAVRLFKEALYAARERVKR